MKNRLIALLRWSERYTKTDMVYLASSGFWLQASSLFISFSSFLLYIIFGHILPKEVYGTYQYLLSLGALVTAFTLTGMSNSVMRAAAKNLDGTFTKSIRIQLLWGVVPLLGSWVFSFYYFLQGNQTLALGLFLVGIFIPFNTTFNTYSAFLSGKKDFRHNFLYSLFIHVPYYVSVALVAFSFPTALALLAANLISQAVGYFIAHRKTLKLYRPNKATDPQALKNGWHFSVMNFLSAAISQIDTILAFHFLGALQLAVYSFATAIPDRIGIFKNISFAAFPKFANKNPREIHSSLDQKLVAGVLVATSIAVVYAATSQLFFTLFFPNYLSSVTYSQIYAFIVPATFGSLYVTALTAHGNVRALYVYNTVAPIVQISLVVFGILWFGLWGLVLARVISAFFSSCLAWLLFKIEKVRFTRNAEIYQ